MNAIENEQVCKSAIGAITRGAHGLDVIPGLIAKIIDTEAWREREVRPGKVVRLKSFRDLITAKPLDGWGENPDKVEALLKDDDIALQKWREAMKEQGKRNDLCSNPTKVKADRGKAYTLSRLKREAPELFDRVAAGELSANAAAIEAGFRKKQSPDDQCVSAFRKSINRLNVLRAILDGLSAAEISILNEWISERDR